MLVLEGVFCLEELAVKVAIYISLNDDHLMEVSFHMMILSRATRYHT
jgi:hypothetical protein